MAKGEGTRGENARGENTPEPSTGAERGDSSRPSIDALGIPVLVLTEDGHIEDANAAWLVIAGRVPAGGFLAAITEHDREHVRRILHFVLSEWRSATFEFDLNALGMGLATFMCVASPFRDVVEGRDKLVCTLWDVTDARRHERQLAFMAGHDPLTGLPNRRSFEEALERAISRAERGGRSALILLDLDHLKELNDARGHLEGDQALVNLAMLLRRYVRAEDIPARIGGDEFAIILEDASVTDALEIAERVREAVAAEEFTEYSSGFDIGVSGGIVEVEPGTAAGELVDRADAMLYAAKEAGRNRVLCWDAEACPAAPKVPLTSQIRHAIENDGVYLVFQPVVEIGGTTVAYHEAFVRARGSSGAAVPPSEFLPAVQRLGLMSRLTERVVEMALAALEEAPWCDISVNLFGRDLADGELMGRIAGLMGAAPSVCGRLLFEVAEGELLAELVHGRAWMSRLKELGCRFVLDDFGSGVGMLLLVREPCLEYVKLSRPAMHAVISEQTDHLFAHALRELIESQGKKAIAAYLESDALVRGAAEAGFVYGQGYALRQPRQGIAGLARSVECVHPGDP